MFNNISFTLYEGFVCIVNLRVVTVKQKQFDLLTSPYLNVATAKSIEMRVFEGAWC